MDDFGKKGVGEWRRFLLSCLYLCLMGGFCGEKNIILSNCKFRNAISFVFMKTIKAMKECLCMLLSEMEM